MSNSRLLGRKPLAATGSTGNNTHDSVEVIPGLGDQIGFQFAVEAVGATPTVTFTYQGSFDNVNFYNIPYVLTTTAVEAVAGIAVTTVGTSIQWLALSNVRQFRFYRCVTTANTNVTYRAELWCENG